MTRARVRLRGSSLDRQLAGGADPSSSAALAHRAAWLTSPRRRRSFARSIRAVRELGTRRPPGPSSAISPDWRELPAARLPLARVEAILELVEEPVYSQGVAMVQLLLTDGLSPLYYPTRRGELTERLESIIEALKGR